MKPGENASEEEQFKAVFQQVFPQLPFEQLEAQMRSIDNIYDFQAKIIVPVLERLLDKSSNGITFDGIDNLQKGTAYLFVSTHRDIVLDSALMNYILIKESFATAEIAIGDNLMTIPWVVDLVKLNKSFIVKRNVAKEEKVQASIQLSTYINHTIKEKDNSIWIAQRSGRSKDGDDRTTQSIIKMFNLGGNSNSALENIKSLNICPVSISYEYNPCDILTMPELMKVAKGEKHEKAPGEDLNHMAQGIQGEKGRIAVSFGKPLNTEINQLDEIKNRNEICNAVAKMIDNQIHETYHKMPTNYIAYDLLMHENRFESEYTEAEKKGFQTYMESRISQLKGDSDFIHHTFLKMYANPVINFLALKDN
jgi:1-acyl-sn-glycerol-3-phosphate acyltransferase